MGNAMTEDTPKSATDREKPAAKSKTPGKDTAGAPKRQSDEDRETPDIIDEAGLESFPASDPPPWTP